MISPRLFAREPEVWPATLRCVARHAELPRMLTHNDVHLENCYLIPQGELGVNDWQNFCKGNRSRDFSYCLATDTASAKRRAGERELLQYYLDQLCARGGRRLVFDDAWQLYRQQRFAALAWWPGTLGQPPEALAMPPPATSLALIRGIVTAIDDLAALDRF